MIMIHGNPRSRQIWEGFSQEQKKAGVEYYSELAAGLAASGELISTEALAAPEQGRRVGVEVLAADGPVTEEKEHLAGFFLVDCANLERALQIAARVPEADLGLVEVRPVIGADQLLG